MYHWDTRRRGTEDKNIETEEAEGTSTNKIPAYIFCFRPGNDNTLLTDCYRQDFLFSVLKSCTDKILRLP